MAVGAVNQMKVLPLRIASALACALLAACTPPPPDLSGVDLSQVNCQPGDLPSTLNAGAIITELPEGAPAEMVRYHTALFEDLQLTYQSFFCSIAVYKDVAAAEGAFETACAQMGLTLASPTTVGDESCHTEPQGIVSVLFRRGTAVVLIQADFDGSGVSKAASAVDGRLK